jgi:hypothetical protein
VADYGVKKEGVCPPFSGIPGKFLTGLLIYDLINKKPETENQS